jgi:hypothetical protein
VSGVFIASYVILWALVGILSVAVFALYQHFGQMYLNQERHQQGPAVDAPFPQTSFQAVNGEYVAVEHGMSTIVVFLSTDCRLCDEIRPALASPAETMRVIAVVSGPRREAQRFVGKLPAGVDAVPDPRGRLVKRFHVGAFPFAVVVDELGVVRAKGIVNNAAGLEALQAFNGGVPARA